jgi:hypothetical protein
MLDLHAVALRRDMENRTAALRANVLTTSALKQGEESRSPLVSPLLLFVGVRFQVSFTPLAGVLFTFPSRY